MIHNTLLAMLVTGSHVPPARLHTIKTALHPSAAQHLLCQDKDCLLKLSGCKGNSVPPRDFSKVPPSPLVLLIGSS